MSPFPLPLIYGFITHKQCIIYTLLWMRIVQKETSVSLRSVYAWLPLQEFEKGHFNGTNICPFAFEVHPNPHPT